jgi:hypothetical protein
MAIGAPALSFQQRSPFFSVFGGVALLDQKVLAMGNLVFFLLCTLMARVSRPIYIRWSF